jgi:hypothetical protein
LAPYRLERRYRRLGFSSFLYHAIGHVWMIPIATVGILWMLLIEQVINASIICMIGYGHGKENTMY